MTTQTAFVFPEMTDEPADNVGMLQALSEMLNDNAMSRITQAFEQMEVVEEELKSFVHRYPDKSTALQKTFSSLRWMLNTAAPEPVYRHHVRELLQRVVDGERLDQGTRAEALMAFHDTSLKAPLTSEASIVALTLFREIYGEVPSVTDHDLREPWPGAGDELLFGLLKRLTQKRELSH